MGVCVCVRVCVWSACGSRDAADQMLLCDGRGCDAVYHMWCLAEPLAAVPEGDWFAPGGGCVS